MKALETIYSLILGPPTWSEGSRKGPISFLNVFNYLREVKLRFSEVFLCVFPLLFPNCSQVAPKCSNTKIHVCKSKKYQELVGAPGFEPGASCAQGRRATRLRYAPTEQQSILRHFGTMLLPPRWVSQVS